MPDPPSDDDRDAFTAELTARLTSPSSHASLSPAVRSVVTETLDPTSPTRSPSLSVPVALVRATAAAGGDSESPRTDASSTASAPSRATLLGVSTSLAFLGGYAKLRRGVLEATRTTNRDRHVAILASDYLHAAAHATLASVSIPTDRHVALYRALTAGSATLAASFFQRKGVLESTSFSYSYSESESNPDPNAHSSEERGQHAPERPTPTAVLAGTGSALGAAVAGSSRETLEAMRTYGKSLVAAIDVVSESFDADGAGVDDLDHDHGTPILETVEQVLLGRRTDPSVGSPKRPAVVPDSSVPDPETTSAVDTHLERARSALDRLPETAPRERLEAATLVPGMVVEPGR